MNEMLEPLIVLKKQKVRTCHLLPLKLEPPTCDVLKSVWNSLCQGTSPSHQADAVNQFGELCRSSDSEDEVAEIFDILCEALFQCSPKAQLTAKIIVALNTLHQSKPAIFAAKIQQVIQTLHTEETVGPGKLCHALALVTTSRLISLDVPVSPQQGIVNGSADDGGTTVMNGDICTELAALKCDGAAAKSINILELHMKLCEVISRVLDVLFNAAFDDRTPHVEVSAKQQALQQVMKSAVAYFQSLIPAGSSSLDEVESNPVATFSPHSTRLSLICTRVLRAENSTLDLRLVCGQLVAVIARLNFGGIPSLISAALDGSAEGLTQHSEVTQVVIEVAALSTLGRIAVLHGILCLVSSVELLNMKVICQSEDENAEKIFGIELLRHIFTVGSGSEDGELTVSCSRLLNHWTLRVLSASHSCKIFAQLIPVSSDIEKKLMEYLEFTWEHYLDRVKHTTYETFMNFLEIRKIALGDCSQSYFMSLAVRLMGVVPHKKFAVSALRCLVKYVSVQELLHSCPMLPLTLIKCLSDFAMAGCSAEAIKALFIGHHREVPREEWQEYWVPLLFDNFTLEMTSFGFELLLKNFLETSPSSLTYAVTHVLKRGRSLNYEHYMLLISCLKVGKNFKAVDLKPSASESDTKLWKQMIPYSILQRCLFHVDEWVQISAFGLICESKKLTESLEEEELNILIEFFQRSLSNDVPSRRQAMRAAAKHLFQRILNCYRGAKKVVEKGSRRGIDPVTDAVLREAVQELAKYKSFCSKMLSILFLYLHPSYCYSRRCCALWILSDYHNIVGKDDATAEISICSHVDASTFCHDLLNCLNDNYLHNKETATELLLGASKSVNVDHYHLFECVFSLASSCKPPDSLTSCHVLKFLLLNSKPLFYDGQRFDSKDMLHMCNYILSRLEIETKKASEHIFAAAASHPMYGLMALLRVAFSRVSSEDIEKNPSGWPQFLEKVVLMCRNVHSNVRFVIENDSPEGNIPLSLPTLEKVVENSIGNRNSTSEDISLTSTGALSNDRISKATGVSAQMLLLCAWRTVKEISGLFADMCEHHSVIFSDESTTRVDIVKEISEYFIQVLAWTKHRGAFEQTYAEYLRVFEQLWLSKDSKLSSVPEKWIDNILQDINSEPDGRFCATRRSAGIPFIILGAVATEPVVRGNICLRSTMTSLLQLASGTSSSSDARLHALNILRVLYRDTKLGDVIIPFVSEGVKSAVCGFSSDVWSIRNSSTLLFAALVTRMLGVKRNKDDLNSQNSMSALLFFKRFPDLYSFLLLKLEEGIQDIAGEQMVASLYPILLLLARLAPSPLEGMTSSLTLGTFVPLVVQCSLSQIFQLRDLSSRALCPLVSIDSFQETFKILCQQARCNAHNSVHGALLCIYRLLEAFVAHLKNENLKSAIAKETISLIHLATSSNPCCVTRCVSLDIFRLLFKHQYFVNFPDLIEHLNDILMEILQPERDYDHVPWYPLMQKSAAEFFIKLTSAPRRQTCDNELLLLVNSKSSLVRTLTYQHLKDGPLTKSLIERTAINVVKEDDLACRLAAYDLILKMLEFQDQTTSKPPSNPGRDALLDSSNGVQKSKAPVSNSCAVFVSCKNEPVLQLLDYLLLKVGGRGCGQARVRNDELGCIIPLLRSLVCSSKDQWGQARAELSGLLQRWSDADQPSDVRLEAARTSVSLLRHLLTSAAQGHTLLQYRQDAVFFEMLECICLQLQDDDSSVRSAAASTWLLLLRLIDDHGSAQGEFSPVDDLKRQFGVEGPLSNSVEPSSSETPFESRDLPSVQQSSSSCKEMLSKSNGDVGSTSTAGVGCLSGGNLTEDLATVTTDEATKEQNYHPLRTLALQAVTSTMGFHGLYGGSIFGFTSLCVDRVLKALLLFIGNIGGARAVSLLCSLVLREPCPPEFGLSEENDRAFDKSETSTHQEELILAEYAVDGLSQAGLTEAPHVHADAIQPHISFLQDDYQCLERCCQPFNATNSSSLMTILNLKFMLCNEICFVCSHLCEKTVFSWQLTNANPWLVKLFKLVLLLHTLVQSFPDTSSSNCEQELFCRIFQRVNDTVRKQVLQTSLVNKILSIVHHYLERH